MVWGQTSSQAEAAAGRWPDQFQPCYGALYIFIPRSLSVRLFLHDLSALLAKPSSFSVMSLFCVTEKRSCSLLSLSFAFLCQLQYFDLSLLLSSFFSAVEFLNIVFSSCLSSLTHHSPNDMTWCCLHILFVISSLFNLLWPSQS